MFENIYILYLNIYYHMMKNSPNKYYKQFIILYNQKIKEKIRLGIEDSNE